MEKDIKPRNTKGEPHGLWEVYHYDGRLIYKCNYHNNKEIGYAENYHYFRDKKLTKNYYL